MIIVGFGKIPTNVCNTDLLFAVKRAFGCQNSQYIAQIESRKSERSQIEGLAALLCLKALIDMIDETDVHQLKLVRSENGKPYFENSDLQFSISHSYGYVACAISDEGEIGIDIEALKLTDERAARLSQRYFDADNTHYDAKSFAREWTRKEAEVKLHGGRLGEYLSQTNDANKNVFFTEFEIDGHPITLCTAKMPLQIEKIEVKFDF